MTENTSNQLPSLIVLPYSISFADGDPKEVISKIEARLIKDGCQVLIEKHSETVKNAKLQTATYAICMSAPFRQNMGHRQSILRAPFGTHVVTITTSRKLVLDANNDVRPYVKTRLEKIAEQEQVTLNLKKNETNNVDVQIIGGGEAVEKARLRLLVALDEMMGYTSESVEIETTKQPAIAGKKRVNAFKITKETGASIYFPPSLSSVGRTQDDIQFRKMVWITGTPSYITKAKEKLIAAEQEPLQSQECTSYPRKIDWLQLHCQNRLAQIMIDNGTFIKFPVLGSGTGSFIVFGHDLVYIKRTIRQVMLLTCEFYLASVNLAQPLLGSKAWTADGVPIPEGLQQQLMNICLKSNAEIVVRSNFIEIFGTEIAVKMAFEAVTKLVSVKPLIKDNRFQVELAAEHREFINGKKMGKVNKIIKTTGCRMLFNEPNVHNMAIEVYNVDPSKVREAIDMLEDEMPAEISFCVPETYHKRIIGVGGKNIQRIMKRFGVYVKFSSQEEYEELGGYFQNEDNVIARTPAKNAENLEALRLAVVELVDMNKATPERGDDVTMVVPVPRELQRFYWCCETVQDVENAFKCKVVLTPLEKGLDTWNVKGPNALVSQARNQLIASTPDMDMDQVMGDVGPVMTSGDFVQVCNGIKSMWIRVVVDGSLARVIYQHQPLEPSRLEGDKGLIRTFLRDKGLQVETLSSGNLVNNWEKIIVGTKSNVPKPIITEAWSSQNSLAPESTGTTDLFSPTVGFRAAEATSSFKSNSPQSSTGSFNYSLFDTSSESAFKNNLGVGSAPDLRFLEQGDYGIHPSMSHPMLSSGQFMETPPPPGLAAFASYDPIMGSPGLGQQIAQPIGSQLQRRLSDNWSSPPRPAGGTSLRREHGNFERPSQPSFSAPIVASTSINSLGLYSQEQLMGLTTPDRSLPPPIARPVSNQATPSRKESDTELSPSMQGVPLQSPGVIGSRRMERESQRGRSFSPPADGTDHSGTTLEDSDLGDSIPELGKILRAIESGQRDNALVKMVLEALGLEKHCQTFEEEEIDFNMFLRLDDGELRELGVATMGSRKKLLQALKELGNVVNKRTRGIVTSGATSVGASPHLGHVSLSSSAGTDVTANSAPSLSTSLLPIPDDGTSPHSAAQAARTAAQSLEFVFADTSPDPTSSLASKLEKVNLGNMY